MDKRILVFLVDIRQSIDEIFVFLGDERDFLKYRADLKTKKAVERNLEIIGEAVGRILKLEPSFSLENARSIIGTRNRIIHSYDNISDEVIWSIVCRELPSLRTHVHTIIEINQS